MRIPSGAALRCAVMVSLGWFLACGETGPTDPNELIELEPLQEMVVSDPEPSSQPPSAGSFSAPGMSALVDNEVSYVSLPSGLVPTGERAFVSSPRTSAVMSVAMIEGGFDPIPVQAREGDQLYIEIEKTDGSTAFLASIVPPRRRPSVVRSVPPRGKTAVPLNTPFIIVFSEPIDATTLSNSDLRLLRDGTVVTGTARPLQVGSTVVVFEPAVALAPSASYQLQIVGDIADLDGEVAAHGIVGRFTTGTTTLGPPDYIVVSPDSLEVEVGAQIQLQAQVKDNQNNTLPGRSVTWRSADPTIATVSATGLVTALAETNEIRILAEGGTTIDGSSVLRIRRIVPVASVNLRWESAALVVGRTEYVPVEAHTVDGYPLEHVRPSTWWSSNPAVAYVQEGSSRYGLIKALGAGVAKIAITIEGKSDTITVTVSNVDVTPPTVASITPAPGAIGVSRQPQVVITFSEEIDLQSLSSSSVTITGGAAVSWNRQETVGRTLMLWTLQQLDYGTTYTVRVSGVRDLSGNRLAQDYISTFTTIEIGSPLAGITSLSLGQTHSCGLTETSTVYCWGFGSGQGGTTAVPVAGVFGSVTSGVDHSCALTTSGAAYCWGGNSFGQLGDGTIDSRGAPVAVTGAAAFASIVGGLGHTCGLTAAGAAQCWGYNLYGQLGDGSTTTRREPGAVTGDLSFSSLTAGSTHTCGLTSDGVAYCWGYNQNGELGDGSTTHRNSPAAVAGEVRFSSISAGVGHTCALTTTGAAYCWGANFAGQLGNDTETPSLTPTAVAGGLTFSAITSGSSHTCALTPSRAAYCWGSSFNGQLGDGGAMGIQDSERLTPTLVVGNHTFDVIDAGSFHTCGASAAGVYCWGRNNEGQLGTGYLMSSSTPLLVLARPQP